MTINGQFIKGRFYFELFIHFCTNLVVKLLYDTKFCKLVVDANFILTLQPDIFC